MTPQESILARLSTHLGGVKNSYFYDLLLLCTVVCGEYFVSVATLEPHTTLLNHLTVLGYIIPGAIMSSAILFLVAKLTYCMSALLWFAGVAPRISAWFAVGSFFLTLSMQIETEHYTRHQPFAVAPFLIALLACGEFTQGYSRRLSDGILRRRPTPMWLYWAPLLWLAIGYTYSGALKLFGTPHSWLDGYGLQLSILVFDDGSPRFAVSRYVVSHSWAAAVMQISTLFAEAAALMVIICARARLFWGLIIVLMHLGALLLFSPEFDFYGNIVMITLLCIVFRSFPTYAPRRDDFAPSGDCSQKR